MSSRFKKGDDIIVISGSEKGKIGKILLVEKDRVLVAGVNLITLHSKPTSQTPGKIKKEERSIHISNISHVENNKPIKIKFIINKLENSGFTNKNRISKKTGKKIS